MIQSCRIIVLLLFLCISSAASAGQKAFSQESLTEIEEAYAGDRFILVLWELSCPPCHGEMAMLGELREEYPDMELVLVGTDSLDTQEEVEALLATHGLVGVDSWLFADGNKERLRYSIDPEWYGELPRNYFYDADGGRTGISGKLDEERVREWLSLGVQQ